MVPLSGGYKNMNDWHTTCLGLKRLPRELSGFEIEAFFNFSAAERRVIEERRKPGLMPPPPPWNIISGHSSTGSRKGKMCWRCRCITRSFQATANSMRNSCSVSSSTISLRIDT